MFNLVVGTFLVLYGTALASNFRNMAVKSARARLSPAEKDRGRPVFFRVTGGIGAVIGVSMVAWFLFP
ncbi:hypothetical protein [Streptomyces sp. NPDC005828]|uniref:hypothetical protein n=1 Tax=Streptomyces sp. NPDC005828 TaxID=3157071 RepID=UPI0034034980